MEEIMKSNIKNTVKVGDILTVKPEEQIWVSEVVKGDWVPKNVKWELAEVVKVYKTADEVNNDKEYPSPNITHEDGDHFPLFRIEDPRRGELVLYTHRFFVDIIKKSGRKS
jgi:hypothetical protein